MSHNWKRKLGSILKRQSKGEFGTEQMTMRQLLDRAGASDLLKGVKRDDLFKYLQNYNQKIY